MSLYSKLYSGLSCACHVTDCISYVYMLVTLPPSHAILYMVLNSCLSRQPTLHHSIPMTTMGTFTVCVCVC